MLEYSYRFDLCYPVGINDYILMQPFPKEESRLSAPTKPFGYEVNYEFFKNISGALFIFLLTHLFLKYNILTLLLLGLDSCSRLDCIHYHDDDSHLH